MMSRAIFGSQLARVALLARLSADRPHVTVNVIPAQILQLLAALGG